MYRASLVILSLVLGLAGAAKMSSSYSEQFVLPYALHYTVATAEIIASALLWLQPVRLRVAVTVWLASVAVAIFHIAGSAQEPCGCLGHITHSQAIIAAGNSLIGLCSGLVLACSGKVRSGEPPPRFSPGLSGAARLSPSG